MATTIPTDAPVLVTGATGYVAGWIIKRLLEAGCTVHATVRNPDNTEKLAPLNALADGTNGSLKFFKADLMDADSFADAMRECSVVFHTASPFTVSVEDPQRDLVDPAVNGTRHVLNEASRQSTVRRVVVTSSCAAIYGDNADLENTANGIFTEDDWNTSSSLTHQAYSYSKTMAEREAWDIANAQDKWTLVTINPSFVLGPAINPNAGGESMSFMKEMTDGTMKAGVPNIGMGIVDVRDVATMHINAAFHPDADGRYITSGHNSSFAEIAAILREQFGSKLPVPKRTIPKAMAWLIGPIVDKRVTRTMVSRNVNKPWNGDHGKSVRDFDISYRSLDDTVGDMFRQQLDAGTVG
ncbi:MAG: aldehyde reductase [Planctomycetota bacterium]